MFNKEDVIEDPCTDEAGQLMNAMHKIQTWKPILLGVFKFFGYCLLFPAMIYFLAAAADPYGDYLVKAGNFMLSLSIFLFYLDKLIMSNGNPPPDKELHL